jgi:two-component sensor histidine kinase
VSCSQDAKGTIVLEVQDNGPGLSSAIRDRGADGLGLRLVHGLVEQIGGTVDYRSGDDGLVVRLSIAASAADAKAVDRPFGSASEAGMRIKAGA